MWCLGLRGDEATLCDYDIHNGTTMLVRSQLNRAAAASERNAFGFARVGEPGLENANAHIQVAVAKTTTGVDTLEDAAARRQANARL